MTATLSSPSSATTTSTVEVEATPIHETGRDPEPTTWSQRTVESITSRLARRRMGRRSFLTRVALIGSALAVDPFGFLFKPQSAWASVCGDANECNQGWSAFCATINNGANTCPSGSYAAGWWKIDNTTFCSGRARYIVDCNRQPNASCSCSCADGDCDRRRVCCNNFRYGQCNTQVRGTTEVVCRIVLCTPPWEWGPCSRTSLTSNQTRTHWSSRLPSRTSPTDIKVRWLEMGLTGSILGDMVGGERSGRDNGEWANFDRGVMGSRAGNTHYLIGPHARAYRELDGGNGWMGYPLRDVSGGNPKSVRFDRGTTFGTGNRAYGVYSPMDDYYREQGAQDGWMGAPKGNARNEPGPWRTTPTRSGWWIVHNTDRGGVQALRLNEGLWGDGAWPPTANVRRTSGQDRWATAAAVSRETHPNGADTVLVMGDGRAIHTHGVGAAAARLNAPVLLVGQRSVPPVIRDELRRLDPRRIIAVGPGTDINRNTFADLQSFAPDVDRWADTRRVLTAIDVSRGAFDGADEVIVTTDKTYLLAMSASPLAAQLNAPVLITAQSRLLPVVRREVTRLGASRATIVGRSGVVSNAVANDLADRGLSVRRVSGQTHLKTVCNLYNLTSRDRVVVAERKSFTNLMSAVSLAVRQQLPILLVDHEGIPGPTDQKLLWRRPEIIKIVGDEDSVSLGTGQALTGYPLR